MHADIHPLSHKIFHLKLIFFCSYKTMCFMVPTADAISVLVMNIILYHIQGDTHIRTLMHTYKHKLTITAVSEDRNPYVLFYTQKN